MTSTLLDLDTYQMQGFNDSQLTPPWSNMSSDTNSRSPCSTSSDTSYTNLQNLNLYSKSDHKPTLVITQQPVDKFRFRYKSEMHGTHGSLMGSRTEKSKKTFPSVELKNFNGTAMIRCSLYQTERNKLSPSQHSHRLVVRSGDTDKNDPHTVIVSPSEGYTAVFQGMGIIHTAKKNITQELINKKREEAMFEKGSELTERESARIRQSAENEAKTMNLNQVCLCFQAYFQDANMMWRPLCDKVFSNSINNMKSALTGELKITRLSAATSCASGGMDLFLFVEKVGKKNIKVRFFECDENDECVWEDWGRFTEADVHHQYGIALQTPAYKDKDIEKHVDVFIQLVRPSDNDRSEPMQFKYKPRTYMDSRKRRRTDSTFNSAEIPTVLQNIYSPQSEFSQLHQTTISDEYNTSGLLNDIISSDLFRVHVERNSEELRELIDCDITMATLETDGGSSTLATPTSVIKSGPNAPPINQLLSNEAILKKVMAITRTYRDDPQNVRRLIVELLKHHNEDGDNILHSSIREGDSSTVQPLLKIIHQFDLGEVLQYRNIAKETCLHVACHYDKPEYIRPLINLGADPNLPDINGNTPLHVAVELNYLMCASRILDEKNYTEKSIKLQINLANDDGQTAIHRAVKLKNFAMTQKLLEMGHASVKVAETKTGNNILHIAVQENAVEIVKYILDKTSIDVNAENNSGYPPLLLASGSSEPEAKAIVTLLLDHNADLKQTQYQHSSKHHNLTKEDEDDEENEVQLPKSSFEMARHNPDILNLLKDHAGAMHIKTENMDFESETISGERVTIFDDECIKKLRALFNSNDRWKKLATKLKHPTYITDLKSNPTDILLNTIQMQQLSNDDLTQLFENIDESEALLVINEMIDRQNVRK